MHRCGSITKYSHMRNVTVNTISTRARIYLFILCSCKVVCFFIGSYFVHVKLCVFFFCSYFVHVKLCIGLVLHMQFKRLFFTGECVSHTCNTLFALEY